MLPQTRPQLGELRVLVIEDEVLVRIALAEELRATGLDVVEAMNADEAWSYLQTGGRADLVFSDISMPGSMDGLEFARRAKAHYPDLNVILTSGSSQFVGTQECRDFLPKPYAFDYAVKFVLEALNLKRRNVR
jgi:CheY-like chemotaxis protein